MSYKIPPPVNHLDEFKVHLGNAFRELRIAKGYNSYENFAHDYAPAGFITTKWKRAPIAL